MRVYDCSGPWGDPAFTGTVEQGLPALRREWILARGDVEVYDGRPSSRRTTATSPSNTPNTRPKPSAPTDCWNSPASPPNAASRFRATGKPVTQLHYARQGIITPEMEFIAIRENHAGSIGSRIKIADLERRHRPQ